jgi:hypothetical protein
MTAILVATIGTRDLMFEVSSGDWYNIGDFQERIQVIESLGLDKKITHRDLTKYLLDRSDQYLDRIKPAIIGKLLVEKVDRITQLYLIATDQATDVTQRDKDSIYSCQLIEAWVKKYYPLPNETKIISLGIDRTNPADFEAMFDWWRKTWREEISPSSQVKIWLGLKGGVGQTSEAGRISGLSLYGDRIEFFDFYEDKIQNRTGTPSNYSEPFLGTNYLWDRTKQQAIRSIDRFDYAGAKELLEPYFEIKNLGTVADLLEAGIVWNRGEFQYFFDRSQSILTLEQQQQGQSWWWMTYEQAYLAVVRLKQNNITEAMLHSFRALEGGLLEWAKAKLGDHFQDNQQDPPKILDSILTSHPKIKDAFQSKNPGKRERKELESAAKWEQDSLKKGILKVSLPNALTGEFKYFWSPECKKIRNRLSHRLGGISEPELLSAWGGDLQARSQWESRILACLNILTGQSFESLDRASLFAKVHDRIRRSIEAS